MLIVACAGQAGQARLQELIALAKAGQPDDWAKNLLLADTEAIKMERKVSGGCCGFRCLRIGDFTLTFRWNDIAQQESYQHDLLKAVVRAQPGTKLGAQALIRLLEPGCGPLADDFVPYFKLVIDILESGAWQRMDEPGLARIRAEAYETWWSLSKAPPNDPMLTDNGQTTQDFQTGAPEARRKAIEAYQRIIDKDPRDEASLRHLQSLQSGRDTQQRNWYCAGD